MSVFKKQIQKHPGYTSVKNWLHEQLNKIDHRYTDELSSDLKDLPDFSELLDMKKASERVKKAIETGERIGLYGDYDADGTTSLALFASFLRLVGHRNYLTYQPNRFVEGYGLHKSSIESALKDGVDLLITFDCGITNHESAEYSKSCGLTLIITDHHNSGEREIPCAYAVVNPNRADQPESDLKKLAGVGVSFSLACETRKFLGSHIPTIYPLLQYFCIGTIGDMVHLNHMNKKLVRHGIAQFENSKIPAIRAFIEKFDPIIPDSEFIGFTIAPIINAKGRMGDPSLSLKLLLSEDFHEARTILDSLVATNEERKGIQNSGVIIAHNKIKKHQLENKRIITIYNKGLHVGIIGLVASMITKEYSAPAIVMGDDPNKDGILKGSVRSIGDFDIFKFLSELDFNFVAFGGHKKAAGFSIKKGDLDEFIQKIDNKSKDLIIKQDELKTIKIDQEKLSVALPVALKEFGPFGTGCEPICFELVDMIESIDTLKEKHLRIRTKGYKGHLMYFNYLHPGRQVPDLKGKEVRILFEPKISFFNGELKLDLFVRKIENPH